MKKVLSASLAFIMVLALFVTGCGSSTPKDDDIVITMSASGDASGDSNISSDATLTYGLANFFAQSTQVYYDAIYGSYYGSSFWSMSTGTDASGNATSTMADTFKENLIESMESIMVLKAHASEYGVSLSDEDEATITEAATEFMEENSDKANKALGASQEIVEEYLRLTTYQTRMQEAIYAQADLSTIDEADAAARTFTYAKIPLTSTDASGNATEITGDELTEYETSAQEIVDKATESGDLESQLTGAGLTAQTYSYTRNETSMASEVIDAADQLSEGQITMVEVEGDAIYIIRLDSEYDESATESNMQSLISQAQQNYYYELVDEWKSQMNFEVDEDAWDQISFAVMYTTVSEEESADASADAESSDASADAE
jgi:foldase protein PrsA